MTPVAVLLLSTLLRLFQRVGPLSLTQRLLLLIRRKMEPRLSQSLPRIARLPTPTRLLLRRQTRQIQRRPLVPTLLTQSPPHVLERIRAYHFRHLLNREHRARPLITL